MKIFLVGIFSIILGQTAYSRIGETPKQCIERYGEPFNVIRETKTLVFKNDDFLFWLRFWNGVAHQITYEKNKEPDPFSSNDLSRNEIIILLEKNSRGEKWKDIFEGRLWETENSKDKMKAMSSGRSLFIETIEFDQYLEGQENETERKDLRGF